jgi:hypothetical protein
VLFMVYDPERAGLAQALLLARNLFLLALPALWLLGDRAAVGVPER